ncbi:MAG: 2-C-methyl-D-erythritol 4-phosphate cytidylyltransferase, partial [Limibacillus sp.]
MTGGTYVLIVAAGRGERLGAALPKQYVALGGRPLLAWSLEAFLKHPGIANVRCVIGEGDADLYEQA